MESINIFLVDDHQFVLDGIQRMLETEAHVNVMGEALNGMDCLKWLEEANKLPDLLITDLSMPRMKGNELVKQVKGRFPSVKILVLTMHDTPALVKEVADAEAEGYLLKSSDKSQFLQAIRHLAEGGSYYSSEVIKHLYGAVRAEQRTEIELAVLTERELEVLRLVMEERSSQEIADQLFISKRTVDTHRKNILQKTGCSTLVSLFKYAYRNGLVN